MKIENSYKITLYDNESKEFNQYIEAKNIDEAYKKAKDSFQLRVLNLTRKNNVFGLHGWGAQKVCKLTKLNGKYRFNFKGGCTTVDCTSLTIFEALEIAKNCRFLKENPTLEIKEIYQSF
jgi:hypothetical protein